MPVKNDETPMAATNEASNLSVTTKEPTKMSISAQISTINVPFYGDTLYLVSHDGEPYTPMKPIVDGMGLAWSPQHEKLKQRFKSTITEIVMVAGDGKNRSMTCLALRKLAGWLHSISVGKVRPELREKVARYQEECDDVLYQYWTKGEVKNPRKKTTVEDRTPLRDAVNMLVGKKGLRYDDAYNMVHQRFNIDSIDELDIEQIPMAVEYVHRIVLDGEFLGKQQELPAPALDINYPLSWWNQYGWAIKQRGGNDFTHTDVCRFPEQILFGFSDDSPSAIHNLLFDLSKAGYDVSAAKVEYLARRYFAEILHQKIERINNLSKDINALTVGIRISPPAIR